MHVVVLVGEFHVFLKPKLKEKLQRRITLDMIEPVAERLLLCSSSQSQMKNREYAFIPNLSIKQLNDNATLSTSKKIVTEISGACYFSKLDTASGYWHGQLSFLFPGSIWRMNICNLTKYFFLLIQCSIRF